MTQLQILSAAPMTTVQDSGRYGQLRHGIAASGPMDRSAWHRAGQMLEHPAASCIEFGAGRLEFLVEGERIHAAFTGAEFRLSINGIARNWETKIELNGGDRVEISPGGTGNFGLVRFDREIDVPLVLGSRATNLIAGLGGLAGRTLRAGDVLEIAHELSAAAGTAPFQTAGQANGPVRVIWGIHADMFGPKARRAFLECAFAVSPKLDRMGMRLLDSSGVFSDLQHLSLVSDVVVPGDVQILGDGTPIVLMRDHQPTGGYPRIATVVGPDLDRLAQMRPGTEVRFASISVENAHTIRRGEGGS